MCDILLVEDNAPFRQSLIEILSTSFPTLTIHEAQDGKETLQKVHAHPPRLIFMDIKLSDENGLNLTKKIKATYPDTVIIILTNYNLPEYQDAAQKAGASYFLTKSLTNALQISELIESILSPIKRERKSYPQR